MGPSIHDYSLFIKIFTSLPDKIWRYLPPFGWWLAFGLYLNILLPSYKNAHNNDIKGEKRIDLSYSIDSGKEIAVIRMLSDNVKYEMLKLHAVMDPISNMKKLIPSGTYASRELLSMLEGMVELNKFEVDDQVTKTNKLKGITEITLNLD